MSKRPFYAIAHRCNSVGDVADAVGAGANAVECDVNWRDGAFWVEHDNTVVTQAVGDQTPLGTYLGGVKQVAGSTGNLLALVLFDLKESINGSRARALRDRVRSGLTAATGLNALFTVSHHDRHAVLDEIARDLNDREGVGIDQDGDVEKVGHYFEQSGIRNACYADGVMSWAPDLFGIEEHVARAVRLKRDRGLFRLVYTWTIDLMSSMRDFIDIGVDGIMTNDVDDLVEVLNESRYRRKVRLATCGEIAFEVAACEYRLRFLGNRRSRNLHDRDNVDGRCQIDEIRHSESFATTAEAVDLGYDGCAWCLPGVHPR